MDDGTLRLLVVSNAWPSPEKPYAGIFVKNQTDRLEALGLQVSVFALERSFTGPIGSIVKYGRATLRFLGTLTRRYDAVHLHFFFPFIWLVVLYRAAHPSTRTILTVHGSDVRGLAARPGLVWLHKFALRSIDVVNAVGSELAQDFAERFGRVVDVVMPAGVDETIFVPEASAKKDFDFIFVGSFIERKGIDLVVEAIELGDSGARYCFVGSGPYADRIEALSRRYDVGVYHNLPQEGIRDLLNRSRFLLFPTRVEPFGLVVTEAAFCGVPGVTSSRGGMKDQIDDGVTGILVDELSPASVRSAMDAALALSPEEYERMSAACRVANPSYALASVCRTLIDLYAQPQP